MRKEKRKRLKKYVESRVKGEVEITIHGRYLLAKITHIGVAIECAIPIEFTQDRDEWLLAGDIQIMYRNKIFSTFIKRPPYKEEQR